MLLVFSEFSFDKLSKKIEPLKIKKKFTSLFYQLGEIRMKDFFKILAITMTIFFIMAGACAYSVYKSHKNFPEYAKKELLYEKYKNYLNSIDQELASSTSLLDFAAKIEKLEHPEEVIYLCLEKESDFDSHSNDNDEIEMLNSGSKCNTSVSC